jgi:CD36 family.
MILTQPHFYDGSEKYLSRVRGLNPNKQDHGIYMDIEPVSKLYYETTLKTQ